MKVLILFGGGIVWYLASMLISVIFIALASFLGMAELFSDELVMEIVYRVIMLLVAIPVAYLERKIFQKWDDWKMMFGVMRRAEKKRREAL